jgi:DNA polymerase III epsilon subunit-like protein
MKTKRAAFSGLYIDVESGGFDDEIHALTSVCVGAFTLYPDKPAEVKTIHLPIRPWPSLIITEQAAKVQGKTVMQLYAGGELEEIQLLKLSRWLWDSCLIGFPIYAHNANFDRGFLAAACARQFPGWHKMPFHELCTPELAACALAGRDGRWNCTRYLAEHLVTKGVLDLPLKANGSGSVSLDPLMVRLGIPGRQGEAHNAEEDVRLGIRVTEELLRLDGWWDG